MNNQSSHKESDMAWKEGLVLAGAGALSAMVNVAFKDSVENVAAEEIEQQLAPLELKIDQVYSSQLRMEDWFRQHLENHE
jgi:hypothetical protein